jgi:ubiquinone/menaquinone biosynthesis C-methylase UbiE
MIESERFWDSTAEKYARKPVDDEAAYAKTLERTSQHLSPEKHVLEIGCGTGTTALKLAPFVAHITGMDISGRMIEIARDKARDQGIKNVTFLHGPHTEIPGQQDDKQFDVVMAFNVLHLLDDPAKTVRDLRLRLKAGGLLISKTPCLREKTVLLRPLIWVMQKLGKAPRVHFINYLTLDDMIRNAGFDIIASGIYPAKTGSRFIIAKRKQA